MRGDSRPLLPGLRPTELRALPHGVRLEVLATGDGEVTTVFAHGLANGIPDTRPLGSAVTGRKVFFQFRGHGRSDAPPGSWGYADLAADLRAVADSFGAARALGVSLGAGALCRLLAQTPDRFDRVVFFLPAVLDRPREPGAMRRLDALLRAIQAGNRAGAAELLAQDIPADLRETPAARHHVRERIEALFRDGLAPALATLPTQTALPDRSVLAEVSAPALVIGCQGDQTHPAGIAEELAAALPHARLHVYDRPGVLWTHRADLRQRIAGFLNAPDRPG